MTVNAYEETADVSELSATRWCVPEGHIPSRSTGLAPQMTSHALLSTVAHPA